MDPDPDRLLRRGRHGTPVSTTVCPEAGGSDPLGPDAYFPNVPPVEEEEVKEPIPPPVLFAFWPIDVTTDEGQASPGWFSPTNWAGR